MPNFNTYASSMLFNDPYLVFSGGHDVTLNKTVARTLTIDLEDKGVVSWVERGPMNFNRGFHQLVKYDSSGVYALGGQDENGNCVSSTEFLDFSSGLWSVTNDMTLTVPRKKFCTVVHEQKLYIIGGQR